MEAFAVAATLGAWKLFTATLIRKKMMNQFEYVGTVDRLLLYPVKGCGGVSLNEATCGSHGVELDGFKDRDLMIVEVEEGIGYYRNMKHYPTLVYVAPSVEKGHVTLNAPGMDPIRLPQDIGRPKSTFTCNLHGEMINASDGGEEVAGWLRAYLKTDRDIRLVHPLAGDNRRSSGRISRAWDNTAAEHDELTFQYFSPYHITNTKSLGDLNSRLSAPIPMDNFRPNIIIKASKAFEEDTWLQIRIGDKLLLRCQEPCLRCLITGLAHVKNMEPVKNEVLKTLRQTTEEILMKLGRDEVLKVPYKKCCLLARSAKGWIQDGAK